MTRTKNLALLGTAATIIIAGTAFAKPKADTNQDGQISKAEFVAAADAKFAKADANGDGVITKEERKAEHLARKQARADKIFAHMDSNNDGVISRTEYDAAGEKRDERRSKRRDVNGDGEVNKEDRKARKAKRKDRKAMRKAHHAKMKGQNRIRRDANQDGMISLAEHNAATESLFLRLDVNGDGVLTKGEGKHRKRGKRGKKGGHR